MESKILKVYYDQNCYPFKDSARETIYPIVGNGFNGFNNTQKIRFYVDRIGGTLDTTWVATTKLPNGKILYELLSDVNYDSEIGEYYVQLSISSLYTQLKGDIFIGLSGYQGGVQVEEDEDTGIYTITGTPTIQATGVIKFTLNYAPQTLNNQSLGLSDLQQVLGYLSNFITQDTSVVVINNTSVDVSGFEDGQMFYNTANNHFYKLVSGVLVEQLNGYVPYSGATGDVNLGAHKVIANRGDFGNLIAQGNVIISTDGTYSTTYTFRVKGNATKYIADEDYVDNNIYEMASASVVLGDSDYNYLLKNNVRIHYGDLFYEKAKETASQVVFYSVDYQRDSTGGKTTRTTKKITLTKSSQQLDAADIADYSYNKAQADSTFAHSLDVSLNTTNYKLTITLKNNDNGGVLSTHTVDLPLESIVVSATYYDSYTYDGTTYTKVIVITLATTSVPTIIPVGDLVDDLATKTELTNGLALKVNKTDIIDNLTTNDATKVLSAKQGVAIQTQLNTKANDSDVVHKTGDETIDGVKTFQKEIKLDNKGYINYGSTYKVDIGTLVGNTENPMIRVIDSQVRIGGNLYPTTDNSYNNGSAQIRWKDFYIAGSIKDGTNSVSLQDFVDWQIETNQKLAELTEAVLFENTLSYSFLQWSVIPNGISTYPILFSANMDMTNIKGNSAAINQLVQNGNFADGTTNWYGSNVNKTIADNVATFTASAQGGMLYSGGTSFISGHKYLCIVKVKLTTGTTDVYLRTQGNNKTATIFTTSEQTLAIVYTSPATQSSAVAVRDERTSDWDAIQVRNFQLFDLTNMGLDTLTTVDEVRSALLSRGINIDEYNAYNEGSLKNSKVVGGNIHHFNLCDEEFEGGAINQNTGLNQTGNNNFRTTNYLKIPYGATLYVKCDLDSAAIYLFYYDANYNFISRSAMFYTGTILSSIPTNTKYIRFMAYKSGSDWGNTVPTKEQAKLCINISNTVLNGTYKPYQAPTSVSLTTPILRSAGSVQDDVSKVRVGTKTNQSGAVGDTISFSDMKSNTTNIICDKGVVSEIGTLSGTTLTLTQAISDATFYYELETPTDQTPITLPENIDIEKGDSIEIVYDNTDNVASDFDFAVITSKIKES